MENLDTVVAEGADQTVENQSVAEPTGQPATEGSGDVFLSDAQLMERIRANPELDQIFRKMQGAYTRKTQSIASVRDAADIVARFNSDPDFARQTIMQRAQQLGLNLQQPGQSTGMQGGASKTMPPELVEAVKTNLSPELQWMAPALAASQWAGMQMALQPIQEQQAQSVRSTRDHEYEQAVEQLSERAPGWEAHEEDMTGLLSFLQSQKLNDRRWGNKLELLHKLVSGDGQATAAAARRMGEAVRSRSVAGSPVASPAFNIAEKVKSIKNSHEAWALAAKNSMEEMARRGLKLG